MIFAARKHEGAVRKGTTIPYFTHVMEAMEIVSRLTENEEIRAAAVLHDTLEDTPTTKEELMECFGQRVADLVEEESENKREDRPAEETWWLRKEETIRHLTDSEPEILMIALGDKLSNIRAMVRDYRLNGEKIWAKFNNPNPMDQGLYYTRLAEVFETNDTIRSTPEYEEYAALCTELFGREHGTDSGSSQKENES